MSKVAIVILNWNGVKFLQQFLPGLIIHSDITGAEVIIADNNSSDDSIQFLESEFPDTRIIQLDKNYGFAGGYNKALEQVEAEYFLLINSDIEVSDGYLPPLIDFMDMHKDVAACAPVLLDFNSKETYEYAGAAGGYIDKFGYTFCRGRIFDKMENASELPSEPLEVFWATGACLMIRAEQFKNAGGFDADFFAHMEEVDLCWRLKNAGLKIAIVPNSKVFHVGGGTLPKQNPFKTYLNFRNNLFLLYKNLPDEKLSSLIRKRKLLDGISALMFFVTLKFKDFGAVYKAHKSFSKKTIELKKYREQHSSTNKIHPEVYNKSVVVDYFLFGRRTFNRLRGNYALIMNKRSIN